MDRQIVYPGQIPLETDLLNTNKNAMIGLAKLAHALMGDGPWLTPGMTVVPTSPASLQVNLNPGQIYSMQNIDGTAYSSLAADTSHTILKQGILLDALALSCAAPTTSGQSINYLIQVAYQDADSGAVALPYYNASNPAQAYSGPNNSGTPQATVRQGKLIASAKAGTSATTGTQTTPAPDAGYIGAWVVTVAYGQTTITSGNISQYAAAPFLPSGGLITGGLQESLCTTAVAGGTADAITAAFTPAITAVTHGMKLRVRAASANATTTPTFTPNSGTVTAWNIVKGAGTPLAAGDIAGAGHWLDLEGDVTLGKWVLLNPATGVSNSSPTQAQGDASEKNANTLFVKNSGLTISSQGVSASASYSVPASAAGSILLYTGTTAGTWVLPLANSVRQGDLILFKNLSPNGSTLTFSVQSGNSLEMTSTVLSVNEAIAIASDGSTVWRVAFGRNDTFGINQSWQDLTASRAIGSTYTNTTGRTIEVLVFVNVANNANLQPVLDGVNLGQAFGNANAGAFIAPIGFSVGNGKTYALSGTGATVVKWIERR